MHTLRPEAHAGLRKLLSPFTASPNIVGEYDTASSLITAIEARRGIALIPSTLAYIAGNRVALRPIDPAPPLRALLATISKEAVGAV
jgi:DNA-binding transcriptional LysR family regulator